MGDQGRGEMASMYEMAYAVHTNTCTYLLDDWGVCRWIVSQQGAVPPHIRQCVGAQFVAGLDLRADGGLIGELEPGSKALFVRQMDDRMVLLRTGDIQRVDDRRQPEPDDPGYAALSLPSKLKEYGQQRGIPYMAKPPAHLSLIEHRGEETSITVTIPTEPATKRRIGPVPGTKTRIHRAEPPRRRRH